MLITENFEKSQEKLDKRGKLGRGAITYDSPCRLILFPLFKDICNNLLIGNCNVALVKNMLPCDKFAKS